jgi:hypothetical protein
MRHLLGWADPDRAKSDQWERAGQFMDLLRKVLTLHENLLCRSKNRSAGLKIDPIFPQQDKLIRAYAELLVAAEGPARLKALKLLPHVLALPEAIDYVLLIEPVILFGHFWGSWYSNQPTNQPTSCPLIGNFM